MFKYNLIWNYFPSTKLTREQNISWNIYSTTHIIFNRKTGISYDLPSYVPSSLTDFCKSLSSGHIEQEVLHYVGLSCVSTLCSCEWIWSTLNIEACWHLRRSNKHAGNFIYLVTEYSSLMLTSKMITTGKHRASASSDPSYWFRFWTTDHMFLPCTALMSSLHVDS